MLWRKVGGLAKSDAEETSMRTIERFLDIHRMAP